MEAFIQHEEEKGGHKKEKTKIDMNEGTVSHYFHYY
jgi:hypothetical protein